MPLTVLSDANVCTLLAGLDAGGLDRLCGVFGDALRAYSVGAEKQFQAHRQGVTRPGGATMLFMPATMPECTSVKIVAVPQAVPADAPPGTVASPIRGMVVVLDADGAALGIVNAAALTAFRTALGSILLYRTRATTGHLVVFGAGRQALWHLQLALVFRRADIRHVTVVNRTAARANAMLADLRAMNTIADLAHIAFDVVAPGDTDALRAAVVDADAIFCTTPSTEPVFPAAWLDSDEGRRKTRFVSAIGSYKLDMQEIDPALLQAVYGDHTYPGTYHPDTAQAGGAVVVDSRDACATEAGELVRAAIPATHLLETGELLDVQSTAGPDDQQRLAAWLATGNVVYKSVGFGIMDLCIARELLALGVEQGVGVSVDNF